MVIIDSEVTVGHVITTSATSPGNNTSEFSKCTTVTAGPIPSGRSYHGMHIVFPTASTADDVRKHCQVARANRDKDAAFTPIDSITLNSFVSVNVLDLNAEPRSLGSTFKTMEASGLDSDVLSELRFDI